MNANIPFRHVVSNEVELISDSYGRSGYILNIGFVWKSAKSPDRYAFVRLDQGNWHRIMHTVRGNQYTYFSSMWKSHLRTRSSEEPWADEECTNCVDEDPDYRSRGADPVKLNVQDRSWTFKHLLRSHPSASGTGRGLKIIAD
jgi:hypothetical protein